MVCACEAGYRVASGLGLKVRGLSFEEKKRVSEHQDSPGLGFNVEGSSLNEKKRGREHQG